MSLHGESYMQSWIDLGKYVEDLDADLELARKLQEEEDRAARISLRRPLGEFNCLLCFDDFDNEEDGILLHCGHATCKDCFRHFAGIAVQNTDFLRCPSCSEPVSSGEVAYLCDQSIAERYSQIETILIRRATDFFHCPTRDCPNSVVIEDRTRPMEFRCDSCRNSYCTRCSSAWHASGPTCLEREQERARNQRQTNHARGNSSSSDSGSISSVSGSGSSSASVQYQGVLPLDLNQNDDDDDDTAGEGSAANGQEIQFRKLVKKGIMRRCACGNYIEKNGGCDYVKCPACGTGFCWQCHQILGAGQPNCKHTTGHGPNPYQFVWKNKPIKAKHEVGHSSNIDDLTADGSPADLESRKSSSKCVIS
eukprot:TRINITY_DN11960_c0_g1_i1.p1 TRINITY_DN11960_c0_g1~~TRINITY_DN11960_c0_g1_i1.p1  ORF type:complete len:365 (+),score=14.94 TRINITY_DN11960_c0_g1_i1:200-1294(+)